MAQIYLGSTLKLQKQEDQDGPVLSWQKALEGQTIYIIARFELQGLTHWDLQH